MESDCVLDINDLKSMVDFKNVNGDCIVDGLVPNFIQSRQHTSSGNAQFSGGYEIRGNNNDLSSAESGSLIVYGGIGANGSTNVTGNVNAKGYVFPYYELATFGGFPEDTADRFALPAVYTGWAGAVLAPNGKIYCTPRNVNRVLIVDIVSGISDTITIMDLQIPSDAYIGGVVAPNGQIYCFPISTNKWLIVDPANNTTSFANFSRGSSTMWGGALAPNGKIYTVPEWSNGTIYMLDPATNLTTTPFASVFPAEGANSRKYYGAVLGTDGKIYCVPWTTDSGKLLVIDPSTNTHDFLSITAGTSMYAGGALAPNGRIYCAPQNAAQILVIDTNFSPAVVSYINYPAVAGTEKWAGAVLAPNGKVYCVPANASQILAIDTTTTPETVSFISAGIGNCFGGVLARDGNVYCIPSTSPTNILKIRTGMPKLPQWMLQPHYNKF